MDQILGGSLWGPALLLPCQVSEGHREKACRSHEQSDRSHPWYPSWQESMELFKVLKRF